MNNITITVSRRSSSSTSANYNEPVYTYSNPYVGQTISARYDDYGGYTQFNENGERVISTRKIHVDPSTPIQEEDLITISYDNIQRRAIKVVPEFGPLNTVFSQEVILLDP